MKFVVIQKMNLPNGGSAEVTDTAPEGTTKGAAIDYFNGYVTAVKENPESVKATRSIHLCEVGCRGRVVIRQEVFNK